MNLVVDDPLSKTRDFGSPIILFPTPKSDNAGSGHFFVPPPEQPAAMPEKGLALGVMKQAACDLRRFRSATKGVRRELYLDAYTWITATDFSWPYSFVNVCKLLDVCPEAVREELFADASLSCFDYWTKRAGQVSQRLQSSFVRVFANCRNPEGAEAGQLTSSV
jgi:hypothetical protein